MVYPTIFLDEFSGREAEIRFFVGVFWTLGIRCGNGPSLLGIDRLRALTYLQHTYNKGLTIMQTYDQEEKNENYEVFLFGGIIDHFAAHKGARVSVRCVKNK